MTPFRKSSVGATLRDFPAVRPESGVESPSLSPQEAQIMGDWQDRPPPPREFAGLRLTRVPKSKSLAGIITCDHMVGRNTHFEHRRTVPCTGDDCLLCADKNPKRWHGYVSICSSRSTTQIVLELTDLASQPVIAWYDRRGTLRGTRIVAERKGNFDNSPVTCTLEVTDVDLRTLPESPDLRRFLKMLWKLPTESGNGQDIPAPRPNIRNTLESDPPGSTPQSEIAQTDEEDFT